MDEEDLKNLNDLFVERRSKFENEQLYEAAKEAITALFSDKSVPVSVTRENLETLQGEIDILLDTLKDD